MVRLVYPGSHFQVGFLIHLLLDLISTKVRGGLSLEPSLMGLLNAFLCVTPPSSSSTTLISLPAFQQRFGFIQACSLPDQIGEDYI